jgi:hypothetical protein
MLVEPLRDAWYEAATGQPVGAAPVGAAPVGAA